MVGRLTTLAAYSEPTEGMVVVMLLIVIPVVAIVLNIVKDMHATRQREQTRREIAAYIAEGSMTPEQGRDLLEAGQGKNRKS